MLKSHEKFHSTNGKRTVLVVDDEEINRELLKLILENDYDVITAEDGIKAYHIIQERHEVLSLVLLDLLMPGMDGIELLRRMRTDPELSQIPVIVLTSEVNAEVESL